ncbi:hypothetical protein JCM3775_007373, partial [Rhodotorula graminis]
MPPKRTSTSSSSRPSKRYRRALDIGSATTADLSVRHAQAQLLAEHAGGGASYLSTRRVDRVGVRSLREIALEASASGLYEAMRLQGRESGGTGGGHGTASSSSSGNIGWNPNRDPGRAAESRHLREFIQSLPSEVSNRLLRLVIEQTTRESLDAPGDPGISVLAVSALFFHPSTTRLSLSSASAPSVLLSRIPQCTALADLDLSSHASLTDKNLANILAKLPSLERLNVKGCTRVGDAAMVALSKTSEDRLKVVNLSLCAVTIKGLTSVFARCKNLEVLKLANVQSLTDKNVAKLVTDST